MSTPIEPTAPTRLAEAELRPRGPVHPSPADWRDQILYFLLPDRFSDAGESTRPQFDPAQPALQRVPDRLAWMAAGRKFQGGTLKGIASKLDYLRGLGVTTLWIGPVWRQRSDLETYHGYGIQNFLDIDPRFGTRQDLRDLVDDAHARGMYVLLDVILNHTGNNWFYDRDGQPVETLPYRYAPPYPFHGWRSKHGESTPNIESLDDGVWPAEFQNLQWYTRAGKIGKWDVDPWESPFDPRTEFRRGDFFDLKDLDLSNPDALAAAIDVYRYWIALSDCDGFRIDTVKHLSWEASRTFCGGIREYAESIGKGNFWLLGEVTGGEVMARNYLDIFGRNLDAVLDIGEPSLRLAGLVKGLRNPEEFFNQYTGHDLLGSHRETGRYHVSILDDHDMVGRPAKQRFSAGNAGPTGKLQAANAIGALLTTLGVPCIYYGTEQAFDGTEARGDPALDPGYEDRYIRESMFGGSFGAFETAGCHFFNPQHPTYLRAAAVARLRSRTDAVGLALRRGRQYLREISFLGFPFRLPDPGELAAWSRILYRQEVVIAVNTHKNQGRGAWVTVDSSLHPPGASMATLYRSDWTEAELCEPPQGQTTPVVRMGGRTVVRIDLPPAGMAVLA